MWSSKIAQTPRGSLGSYLVEVFAFGRMVIVATGGLLDEAAALCVAAGASAAVVETHCQLPLSELQPCVVKSSACQSHVEAELSHSDQLNSSRSKTATRMRFGANLHSDAL